MNIQGTYTNKGIALTAKIAAGACLRVTRVVGGSGHTTDVPNAVQLPEIRQTLTVGEARCGGDTAVLPVTLAAVGLESSYTLTELGVYAEDPNEGEILYCVYRLDEPVTIQGKSDTVLRFYLRQTVSEDGGAAVLCSPAGLVTESDCGPARKMVLATSAPRRYVAMSASELQAYLDALPRLLTEHHVITLSGTRTEPVQIEDFYGSGSLMLRADNLEDCVFTRKFTVNNCSVPVIMEKLKWELGSNIPYGESCIFCTTSEVMAQECSFTGYVSPDGRQVGRAATTLTHGYFCLRDCKYHNLEIVINCFCAGYVNMVETEIGGEYSGNSIGVLNHHSGQVMFSDKIPATLGSGGNIMRNGGVIIQGGKFI